MTYHLLLLPIGFVLGWYLASRCAQFKAERVNDLHKKQMEQAVRLARSQGVGMRREAEEKCSGLS